MRTTFQLGRHFRTVINALVRAVRTNARPIVPSAPHTLSHATSFSVKTRLLGGVSAIVTLAVGSALVFPTIRFDKDMVPETILLPFFTASCGT